MAEKMRYCLVIFCAFFVFRKAHAFTYFDNGAKLTQDQKGQIFFQLSKDVPTFTEKENFEGGKYSSLSNKDIYVEVINRAMDLWNKVPGKFYTLKIGQELNGTQDSSDNLNSIAFGELSLTAGASASPQIGNSGRNIVDCDITIPESAALSYFAKAVAHEMGHCLGLGHDHKDMYALMSYNLSEFRVTLDDAAGAASLYPSSSSAADKNFVPCGSLGGVNSPKETKGVISVYAALMILFPLLCSLIFSLGRMFASNGKVYASQSLIGRNRKR